MVLGLLPKMNPFVSAQRLSSPPRRFRHGCTLQALNESRELSNLILCVCVCVLELCVDQSSLFQQPDPGPLQSKSKRKLLTTNMFKPLLVQPWSNPGPDRSTMRRYAYLDSRHADVCAHLLHALGSEWGLAQFLWHRVTHI